jgi:hypothetical protein
MTPANLCPERRPGGRALAAATGALDPAGIMNPGMLGA